MNSEKFIPSLKNGALTPKKPSVTIKHDAINPRDYLKYKMPMSCEECTHFKVENESCTLGYWTKWHRQSYQVHSYETTGKVAICRFMEID